MVGGQRTSDHPQMPKSSVQVSRPLVSSASTRSPTIFELYTLALPSASRFNVAVLNEERSLRKSILSYLGTSSSFTGVFNISGYGKPQIEPLTEPEISPVLSPVTKVSRGEDRRVNFAGQCSCNLNLRVSVNLTLDDSYHSNYRGCT